MTCPPIGICVHCRLVKVHDGDTVYVRVYDPFAGGTGLRVWRIRLCECWAPETNKDGERERGIKAREFLKELVGDNEDLRVYVPLPPGWSQKTITTMGRVMGRIFVGSEDVSEVMVRHGHATKNKPKDRKE